MRVVLDTNVVVSALLFNASVPGQAVEKVLTRCQVCVTSEILAEYRKVLARSKFRKYLSAETRTEFLFRFEAVGELVEPSAVELDIDLRDAKDRMFLEAAHGAQATCLISGDDDLLVLQGRFSIPILSPAEFLALNLD